MAQDYDKIIKENLEQLLPALIRSVIRIPVKQMKKIPFDTQITLERKPDYLLQIELPQESALLQLEFQTSNDAEMVERMLEYYSLQRRKYKLPVYQFVLYLGSEKVTMATQIQDTNLQFRYELIYFQNLDYRLFLAGETPEEIILAILGNYMGDSPAQVIDSILKKLIHIQRRGRPIGKYISQLEILGNLRNLQSEIIDQTHHMALNYDITKDIRFQQGIEKGLVRGLEKGIEKGIEQGKTFMIRNLLKSELFVNGRISYQDIAQMAQVTLPKVLQIHQQLKKEE